MKYDDKTLRAARQSQFLEVIGRDEAYERFTTALPMRPLGVETVPLSQALGRVLAANVAAPVDVPAFDRANVDGFAVHAADTAGAYDERPRQLRLGEEVLRPGRPPESTLAAGEALPIATGAMLPRGADAVVMIEHTDLVEERDGAVVEVRRATAPGAFVSFAGSDMARGETVLRTGTRLTSREIGVLAAVGLGEVVVWRRPRVAILSTGDEIVPVGQPPRPAGVYDSNGAILAAAVVELGCEPVALGVVGDDENALRTRLREALGGCDAVLLSGGTSKGAGDLSYCAVEELGDPGVIAHGVALKPGKPICLAVSGVQPVVVLPGFPTSAIFTFHEFVAPVLRAMAGVGPAPHEEIEARLAQRVSSEKGRTEYLLVGLVPGSEGLAAYPMGKGSGAVTAFSFADGFITLPAQTELVAVDTPVRVQLLGPHRPADLVAIGSHCIGLDHLMTRLQEEGYAVKAMHVGSQGGLAAAERGECDVAGVHLFDPDSGEYNRPFLSAGLSLIPGYGRLQGLVCRPGDIRFEGKSEPSSAVAAALADTDCVMVNRNAGSGTRVLVDRLLDGQRPPGYAVQVRSHNAVAAALAQGRADWGVAIRPVAEAYGLAFIPLVEERYDLVVPASREDRPAVRRLRELLADEEVRAELRELGFGE